MIKERKYYTIEMASGTTWGGKYADEIAARKAHSYGNDTVVSVEQRHIWDLD